MKILWILAFLALQSSPAQAISIDLFKDEHGVRNWQHLANWTGGILLILLTIVLIYLLIARRKLHKTNRELTAIRNELERRVQERTANLNESNERLQQEIAQHVITSDHLRTSEAYIKDILSSMPIILVSLDQDGYITQWNYKAEEATDIKAGDALGRSLWEVYPKVTVTPEQIHDAIKNNKTLHYKKSLRSVYHYDITIYPLQESEAGVVILVDDITKQTTAENLLIHNDKMSFMGELASTMAHDINLPLQSLMMDLRRFQRIINDPEINRNSQGEAKHDDTGQDDEQIKLLNDIVSDMSARGKQVSNVITNLLAFARSRNSDKQMANIIDVMENSIRVAGEVITVTNGLAFDQISIKREFEKQLPLIPCYITELQQVFLSLLRHAYKAITDKQASEDFAPEIKVIISASYDNIWIKVQHNGLGLTAEEQMSLFEPFFTDKTSTEDFDVGQRLSFSYYIVTEQHQGNMAVTSDLELGSTIHIQLPVRD